MFFLLNIWGREKQINNNKFFDKYLLEFYFILFYSEYLGDGEGWEYSAPINKKTSLKITFLMFFSEYLGEGETNKQQPNFLTNIF